jgi:hypoxanthine phosphoribosyltransferase
MSPDTAKPMGDVRHLPWGDFYRRMGELATAYLREDYDRVYFAMRGGMTPAHRLAHVMGWGSGGEGLCPLYIRRHQSDNVQSATVEPVLARPLDPVPPGAKLLLVEDTIGEGKTVQVAIQALAAFQPAVLDVVSVGLDHRDWLMKSGLALDASPLRAAVVGFDYWGWMVFPWENQAVEAPGAPERPTGLRPLTLKDDQYEAVAGAVLGPGGPGPCVVLTEANWAEAATLPEASVDWVVVRDLLPSRLEILYWRELAGVIKYILRPGGRLVFAYMDRTRIQGPRDISPDLEYYTPDLAGRLLAKAGFAHTQHLGSSERASFARATRP